MARGYEPQGLGDATGGIAGREAIEYLAEAAVLGTATVPELIREADQDVLLALTAVNKKAIELRDSQYERLAHHIVAALAKAWK